MAAELKEAYGTEAEVTPGAKGQFDVFVDDRLIYSKAETRKFPDPGEAVRLAR